MALNDDQARATVAAFLRRADRLMATSAAQREDLATIGTTMKVLVRLGQREQSIERSHLPVPELHEAANVLRPFVLQKERIHLGRVLGALVYLTGDAPTEVFELAKDMGKTWSKYLEAERWIYMAASADGGPDTRLTDVEIAEHWLYGEAWHNDEARLWALRRVSDSEAMICATVWVADRILMVRAIQQFIVDAQQAGHLR